MSGVFLVWALNVDMLNVGCSNCSLSFGGLSNPGTLGEKGFLRVASSLWSMSLSCGTEMLGWIKPCHHSNYCSIFNQNVILCPEKINLKPSSPLTQCLYVLFWHSLEVLFQLLFFCTEVPQRLYIIDIQRMFEKKIGGMGT